MFIDSFVFVFIDSFVFDGLKHVKKSGEEVCNNQ